MRKIFAAILLPTIIMFWVALPAYAAEPAKPERTQQTVELGNNRFLIFVGEPNDDLYAYTADLIVLKNGIPHFEPLFMEEYDAESNAVNLSEGLVFQAKNYHYDKADSTLDITTEDAQKQNRFEYKYHLDTDIMKLKDVIMQNIGGQTSAPIILYRAEKGGK